MREIRRAIIHHSASPTSTTTEMIREWHLARRWKDIGYHYVIEEDGQIKVGRSLPVTGAHCKGFNADSIGIVLTGDNTRPEHRWTQAQIVSLQKLIESIRLLWPTISVVGHRELRDTECPGLDIEDIV